MYYGSEGHDQESTLTEMSRECCFLDVNFIADHFWKIPELCEVDRKDRDRS